MVFELVEEKGVYKKLTLKGCLACESKHEDEWFVDCKCMCHKRKVNNDEVI